MHVVVVGEEQEKDLQEARGQAPWLCGGRSFQTVERPQQGFVGFSSKCDGKLLGSFEQGTGMMALIVNGSL